MTDQLHPGSHPDAELLSAFLEGGLPEHERTSCLSHFAECERCREIVFLAQPAKAAEATKVVPAKRGWSRPLPIFAGALAAAALIFVLILPRPLKVLPVVPAGTTKSPAHAVTPSPQPTESARASAEVMPAKKPRPPQLAAPSRQVTPPEAVNPLATKPAATAESDTIAAASAAPAPPPPPAAPAVTAKAAPKQLVIPLTTGAIPSVARNGLSEVKGRVRDATGAAISGAVVTVRPLSGNTNPTTRTNASGEFTISALPAGKYEVQIESPGFQREATQMELKAQDVASLEATLKVGSMAETVEVTAGSATVETSAARVGSPAHIGLIKRKSQQEAESAFVKTLASGRHNVALDRAGKLFYRKGEGKDWKAVKPKWPGNVTQIAVVNDDKALFQLVTDEGAVWLSPDGAHWHSGSNEKK